MGTYSSKDVREDENEPNGIPSRIDRDQRHEESRYPPYVLVKILFIAQTFVIFSSFSPLK